MYPIEDVAAESHMTTEDIRLVLSDVREDWESCETLTEAEYRLILQSAQAKEKGTSSIAPLPPGDMPLGAQQKLVESAAQVLNTRLTLVIGEEIALFDALDRAKNHIILQNREQRRRELAEALGADWSAAKEGYLDSLRSLTTHTLPQTPVTPDTVNAKQEISAILGKLGVETWQ